MDTDTLFLTPVETVWEHFHKFNSSQMAALAPEHEDPNVGWYNRFAKHPYYGKLGEYCSKKQKEYSQWSNNVALFFLF